MKLIAAILVFTTFVTCCASKKQSEFLPEESHGKSAEPNYSIVFPQNKVNKITIKIAPVNWAKMNEGINFERPADFDKNHPRGVGKRNDFPGENHMPPPQNEQGVAMQKTKNSQGFRKGQQHPNPPVNSNTTPEWVSCNISFKGNTWENVGIRYKGNSSLHFATQMGIKKLSFKLDFDEFEDEYPEIKDQRFYGFKQLNLKNNFLDASLVREKVAADLFREFGIVSPQTAFYQVFVDYGEGEKYYGIYTMVEEVDDTVLKSNYKNADGNLYKPERLSGTFSKGSFNKNDMHKKSNKKKKDYSDIRQLYDVINSPKRTSDYEGWKKDLESVFDTDIFLKWLATNTVIQNWDTYGKMSHNYYLYHNPKTDKLEWIPWDNNEAFQEGKHGGELSLSLSEADSNWPLISYLMDTPDYRAKYEVYLQQFVDEVFIPDKMKSLYNKYFEMLKEYAYAEEPGYTFISSNSKFDQAVKTLKTHVQNRNDAVNSYLKKINKLKNIMANTF